VIKRTDIQVAAEASNEAYGDSPVGTTIPNTNFNITRIFYEHLTPKDKIGLKAIMADNGDGTVMIAYRGTNG